MSFKGIIMAEGDFEGVVEFPTEAELEAYRWGFLKGCELFRGDNSSFYTLKDLPELDSETHWSADKEIAELVRKHCL